MAKRYGLNSDSDSEDDGETKITQPTFTMGEKEMIKIFKKN